MLTSICFFQNTGVVPLESAPPIPEDSKMFSLVDSLFDLNKVNKMKYNSKYNVI